MAQRLALTRAATRFAVMSTTAPSTFCGRATARGVHQWQRPLWRGIRPPRRRISSSSSAAWAKADQGTAAAKAEQRADAKPEGTADEVPEMSPYEQEVAEVNAQDPSNPVPVWQNPRHHRDPKKQKVFYDEFEEGETPETVPLPPFDDGSGKVLASPELHAIAEEILAMNMMEVKELVDRIGDHFGLEKDNYGFGGGVGGGGGGDDDAAGGAAGAAEEEEAKEERTAFDVKLVEFDAKAKIKVIKEVRAAAGLGLKEAKEMVEGAPKVIKKDVKMEEAKELKKKLEELGATVEIV